MENRIDTEGGSGNEDRRSSNPPFVLCFDLCFDNTGAGVTWYDGRIWLRWVGLHWVRLICNLEG
jgi:hypothetical protein